MRVDDDHRRRLLMQRQLLGGAARTTRSVADVAAAIGPLHSTDPVSPYLSIHARADATVDAVSAAFYRSPPELVRHTTIRRTVFAMSPELMRLAHGAYNAALVARLRDRLHRWIDESPDAPAPGPAVEADAGDAVVETLRRQGALTGTELAARIELLRLSFDPVPGASYSKPMRITSKVLEILAAEGKILRGAPTGSDITSAAWTWIAAPPGWAEQLAAADPAASLAALLDRYLAAFGPATVTDMAWWTGLGKTKVRTALSAIDATDVELDSGDPGWIRRDDDLDVVDVAGMTDGVAVLPGLDSTIMGWKQRGWYVDDSPSAGLFDRNGNAGPTIVVDGVVVGSWTQRTDGSMARRLLVDVGAGVRAAIDDELERVRGFLGDVRVKWRYPTPITKQLLAD